MRKHYTDIQECSHQTEAGVYEEAIEGGIASCVGRNAAWEIICVLENEEYPDSGRVVMNIYVNRVNHGH